MIAGGPIFPDTLLGSLWTNDVFNTFVLGGSTEAAVDLCSAAAQASRDAVHAALRPPPLT